jgi:glutaminase
MDDEDVLEVGEGVGSVSTGHLPSEEEVVAVVLEAYQRYRGLADGLIAGYIPALANASADLFGICLVSIAGRMAAVGDADHQFSIQSISKVFTFALVCESIGWRKARDRLGVNSTGLPFNSVMAIELNQDRTINPMVNAGAIAATSLAPGDSAADKFAFIANGLSRFAGRELCVDDEVYESEAATNFRNRGIAHLLDSYGRMYCDPDVATDTYTRQCSLAVSARDLAVMAATLADGGVNPVTRHQVVSPDNCKRVLAVLATAGLYERSGDWLFEVGLPGKSGVSGGMITVSPGKGGLATFSPPLDEAGNSVRGQRVTRYLSERLGLNLFASSPLPAGQRPGLRPNTDQESP